MQDNHNPQEPSPQEDHPRNSTKRPSSISRGSAAYPRKRAVTACQACRFRRTKCDQKKPACSFCEKIGAECVSIPGSQSTFDPASLVIIERLDKLEQKLDSIRCLSTVGEVAVEHGHGLKGSVQHDLRAPIKFTAETLLPQNLDAILNWPVIQDIHLVTPVLRNTPSVCSAHTPVRATSIADELTPTACEKWVGDFFQHSHCKNPILNEQDTWRLVRKVCSEGLGWDSESCLVLLVCANGALSRPLCSPTVSSDEVESIPTALYTAALKRIGSALDSSGVLQAQCFFLCGVFLMSTLRSYDAWRMFLQALSMCHRFTCQSLLNLPLSTQSATNIEAKESIYWSSWKSEREVRWELGLPDFSGMSLETPRTFPSCSERCEGDSLRAWYFYLSEISLWRLEIAARNEMRSIIAKSPGHVLEALARVADDKMRQATAWENSLPPLLSIADGRTVGELANHDDILRFVLRGRLTYFHELISWPFIYAVINSNQNTWAIRNLAKKGLAFHLERLHINRPGFYHRHHGTWLMINSSVRSACILLISARVSALSDILPLGWQEAIDATLSMLQFWSNEGVQSAGIIELMRCLRSDTTTQ